MVSTGSEFVGLKLTSTAALVAEMVNTYISTQLATPLQPAQTQASHTSGPLAQQASLTSYEVIKQNIINATPPSESPEPPRAAEPPLPTPEVPCATIA
jgi:hypothetical protein